MPGLENIDDQTLMEAARFHGLDAPQSQAGFDGVDDATLMEAAAFHGLDARSFGERMGDAVTSFVSDTAQGAVDLFTGDKTWSVDVPELPSEITRMIIPGEGMLGVKMGLARGDLGKLDIFKRGFPDAPARIDEFGNVLVEMDGQEFYLNRPGLSGQDVTDLTQTALIELPFALGGGRVLKGLGKLGTAIGTGLGVGTGSVVQDLAAQGAGSNQPIDLQTAAISALAGGAFEFAAPLLKPFFSRFFRNPAMVADGAVTSEGRKVLTRAGIDPDEIGPDFAARFQEMARDAVDPEDFTDAARRAGADEFGIPLSRGDASGNVVQQGFEDSALKGALGDDAANTLTGFRTRQSDAILDARGELGRDMGGQGLDPLRHQSSPGSPLRGRPGRASGHPGGI